MEELESLKLWVTLFNQREEIDRATYELFLMLIKILEKKDTKQ